MTFFGVVGVLGQVLLVAMGAIVILTALIILAGIAYPPLLQDFLY